MYTHLEDVQDDDGPGTLDPRLSHLLQQDVELGPVPLDDAARAEEAHDARGRAEAAEHERDAGILVDMRDGLAAGARGVDVGHGGGREDLQRGRRQTLG